MHDKAADAWVPRQLLRAAGREHMGHYRRVNPHVWNIWTDLYRGSGPALWVVSVSFYFIFVFCEGCECYECHRRGWLCRSEGRISL